MFKLNFTHLLIFTFCLFYGEQNVFAQDRTQEGKDFVQRILLDKPITAGELKVFPSFTITGETNEYYYLPNKLTIATDPDGKPMFSFLRYVENKLSDGSQNKSEIQADGGGIVHFLVGLHVSEKQIRKAESQLKQKNPDAKIVGPVIYRSGTMSLVSFMPEEQQKISVIGVGKAPILEGDNIAISMILDKKNAKILWEMMKMPTPPISMNLDMIIGGYQSPVEFTIDMDFSKIYQHEIFQGSVGIPIFSAEINKATQDLKQTGAIKVTLIGQDQDIEKIMNTIENKLIDMCFSSFGSEQSPKWDELAKPSYASGKSFLDQASQNSNAMFDNASKSSGTSSGASKQTPSSQPTRPVPSVPSGTPSKPVSVTSSPSVSPSTTPVPSTTSPSITTSESTTTPSATAPISPPTTATSSVPRPPSQAASSQPRPTTTSSGTSTSSQVAETVSKTISAVADVAANMTPIGIGLNLLKSVKVTAVYQTKTIKQEGHYTASAKHYFTTSLPENFAGNIGKIDCPECFKQINLWDPLYVQREISAFVDGDTKDFERYINYVTLSIRKKHPKGDITTDDIRIDRNNFNSTGNLFKVMYGWMPGDNNRKDWLNYEYKLEWSFFGGGKIDTTWLPNDQGAISLTPPMVRRSVRIEADSVRIQSQNIRSIDVRIYYKLGGEEQIKQITLVPNKNQLDGEIDFAQFKNSLNYDFEINWLLSDNTTIESGRKSTKSNILYVDVLPKK